jgi:Tetratricopeptide repeat
MFARDFATATAILETAIQSARALQIDPSTLLGLINAQAVCLKQMGRLQEARAFSLETLQLRERMLGPDDRAVALSLGNYASLLAELGEFKAASEHLNRAEAIYAQINDPSYEPAAALWRSKGLIAWLQNDLAGAELAWNEVNRRYAALERVSLQQYPFTYHDQAMIALAKNQPNLAAERMQQMFANAAAYLQNHGKGLNINQLKATAAIAHCRSEQADAAQDWLTQLREIDIQNVAPFLRSHYLMAQWECAVANKDLAAARALASNIQSVDAQLPPGRMMEVQRRAQRLSLTNN